MKRIILFLFGLMFFINIVSAKTIEADKIKTSSTCKTFENLPQIDLRSNYVYMSGDFVTVYYEDDSTVEINNKVLYPSSNATLTYVDPYNNEFYLMGHNIIRNDIPIENSSLRHVEFVYPSGYQKHSESKMGQMNSISIYNEPELGKAIRNNSNSVSGTLHCDKPLDFVYEVSKSGLLVHNWGNPLDYEVKYGTKKYGLLRPIEVTNEVKRGKAYIYTTLPTGMKDYIEINILSTQEFDTHISFVIEDEEFMETYGGILKGMSGSPIIQNGKLIGGLAAGLRNSNVGYFSTIERMQPDFFENRKSSIPSKNIKHYSLISKL